MPTPAQTAAQYPHLLAAACLYMQHGADQSQTTAASRQADEEAAANGVVWAATTDAQGALLAELWAWQAAAHHVPRAAQYMYSYWQTAYACDPLPTTPPDVPAAVAAILEIMVGAAFADVPPTL